MGICQSSQDSGADAKSKAISAQMKAHQKAEDDKIKLLLLGAGESGKTTILKQMKVLHLEGYDEKERTEFIPIIRKGCIANMRELINGAKSLGIAPNEDDAEQYLQLADSTELSSEVVNLYKRLWESEAIQSAYQRRSEFQLVDSASYFFDNIERIAAINYAPTEEDILKCRVRTTGIHSINFSVNGSNFEMFDVGGQRSERRKWIHCFENVTAVVFVAALSEYDQLVREDETSNRMIESLTVFREICNVKYFANTSLILFLNKRDLFAEKIKDVDLKCCFPDYSGGCDYDKAVAFIQQKFESQNHSESKTVFTHVTCATDTNNIAHVFKDVQEIIFSQNMTDAGLI